MFINRQLLTHLDDRWMSFIDSTPESVIFHHPAWIELIAECYGYRPFIVALCDDQGKLQAGLPVMEVRSSLTGNRWVSLPFSDHCKPLYKSDSMPIELYEYLSDLRVKNFVPLVEIKSDLTGDNQIYKNANQVLHLLELSPDPEEVFTGFHYQVRKKSIARAERDGVDVRWAESKEDLDTFYDLHLKTRGRLGVPIQPKRYFKLIWERIIKAGLGFMLLAYIEHIPIAGAVFLIYKNKLFYKYSASDKDYRQFRANHLLLWTAIRWGCEHSKSVIDFGRTAVSDASLCSFKRSWGADEIPLVYSTMANNPPKEKNDLLQYVIGNVIRRSPLWVCRATGEMLYRHYG